MHRQPSENLWRDDGGGALVGQLQPRSARVRALELNLGPGTEPKTQHYAHTHHDIPNWDSRHG
jgi:hypothetical protein